MVVSLVMDNRSIIRIVCCFVNVIIVGRVFDFQVCNVVTYIRETDGKL